MRSIKGILDRLNTSKKIIDISSDLTKKDYELIRDMMNLHKGKYIDLWKGFSDTDLIPNIQKLALFNRTMHLTKQTKDFLKFDENKWSVVLEGIIKKPKESIIPLLEYKINSSEMNNALSSGKITPLIQKKINAVSDYINLFETKKDLVVHRGEGGYGILDSLGMVNGKSFSEIFEGLENFLIINKHNSDAIKEYEKTVQMLLQDVEVIQKRFLSTAMTENATEKYAKKIKWTIIVPKGTKGASIESFTIEREAEAEFLLQKGTRLQIVETKYNPQKNILEFKALAKQIDK